MDQSLCEGMGKPECTEEETELHAAQQLCSSTAQESRARMALHRCFGLGQGGWPITECGLSRGRSLVWVERTLQLEAVPKELRAKCCLLPSNLAAVATSPSLKGTLCPPKSPSLLPHPASPREKSSSPVICLIARVLHKSPFARWVLLLKKKCGHRCTCPPLSFFS